VFPNLHAFDRNVGFLSQEDIDKEVGDCMRSVAEVLGLSFLSSLLLPGKPPQDG
jgi:hypothetical protein